MNLIVCIDDNNGLMFNKRRVSKDIKIIDDIETIINNNKIICSSYTKELFINRKLNIEIKDTLNEQEISNDKEIYYFMENNNPKFNSINKIIIYKFNRIYPSDIKFSYSLDQYQLINVYEFTGNSHEKITRYIYVRGDINEISY